MTIIDRCHDSATGITTTPTTYDAPAARHERRREAGERAVGRPQGLAAWAEDVRRRPDIHWAAFR